jgi:hypothetical protein
MRRAGRVKQLDRRASYRSRHAFGGIADTLRTTTAPKTLFIVAPPELI